MEGDDISNANLPNNYKNSYHLWVLYYIPRVRRLTQRLTEIALAKQTPMSYQQNNLLLLESAPNYESQKVLKEFKNKTKS